MGIYSRQSVHSPFSLPKHFNELRVNFIIRGYLNQNSSSKFYFTDFRLSRWLTVCPNLVLGRLRRMDAGSVADVSEVLVSSIFSVEECKMGFFYSTPYGSSISSNLKISSNRT
jgi:hypothetical protein